MPKLVWLNQPTNHSGTVNYLYLDPDGEIDSFTVGMADGGGPFILGGPALSYDQGDYTEAGLTLTSLLPAGFHFFPESCEAEVRETAESNKEEITDDSSILDDNDWRLRVYSKVYSTTQACDLLVSGGKPESAIVFVDGDEEGEMLLACELAKLYYDLSKKQREELDLSSDWNHHIEA